MIWTFYLGEYCAQVSQIVFFADLTVLQLITTSQILNLPEFIEQVFVFLTYFTVLGLFNCISKMVTLLISLWTVSIHRAFYHCIKKNKSYQQQVSQIVFLVDLTVYGLLQLWRKMSKNSYELCAQVSQNVFLADLNVSA